MSVQPPQFSEDAFGGTTRLFPLPGLVMFPHVVQALHIFEPRYRDMLSDAMATDQLISMAVLAEGWHKEYEGNPPIEPIVCLGQIINHTQLPDGCSNILLMGLRRGRIIEEFNSDLSFRTARIELLPETDICQSQPERSDELKVQLMQGFQNLMPKSALAADQLAQTLGDRISLGILTDLIAYSIKLSIPQKTLLLAETRVESRAEHLLHHLKNLPQHPSATETLAESDCKFPPDFSAN
jgi:Lon protease-like protein